MRVFCASRETKKNAINFSKQENSDLIFVHPNPGLGIVNQSLFTPDRGNLDYKIPIGNKWMFGASSNTRIASVVEGT